MVKKGGNLLKKFVCSYIIVITLVLFAAGTFNFVKSTALIRNEAMVTGQSILEEGIKALDSKYNILLNLKVPLRYMDGVLRAAEIERPFPLDSVSLFSNIQSRLNSYAMMADFADAITLYYQKNKLYISNRSSGIYTNAYFNAHMDHYGIDYEDWDSSMIDSNYWNVLSGYSEDGQPSINFVSRLPATSESTPTYMLITVSGRNIGHYFESLDQYSGSSLCVAASDGELYYASTDEKTARYLLAMEEENKDYLVLRAKSEEVDLEYIAFIPKQSLYRENYLLIRDLVIIYLLIVAVSLVLFIFLSYQNILPLKKLVEKISQNQGLRVAGSMSEADFIGSAYSDLFHGAKTLAMSLQDSFFAKLLAGEPITSGDMRSLDERCMNIFHYEQYQVAVIKTTGAQEIGQSLALYSAQIKGILHDNIFLHHLDSDRLALVFCWQAEDFQNEGKPEKIIETALTLCMGELERQGVRSICAVGNVKPLTDQIYISCQNACWLLRQPEEAYGAIRWYTSFAVAFEGYYYPDESKRRFANLILAGEFEAAAEEIASLYEINFKLKSLSAREKGYFTDALIYDFIILKRTVGVLGNEAEEHYQYIMALARKNPYPESNSPYFIILSRLLVEHAKGKTSSRAKTLLEQIIGFVGSRYMDSDFGLTVVAKHMGMSEKTIAAFFKRETGESIPAYIEKIRIHNAARYINVGDRTVKEVAEMVGYSNLNTFYKAFKRRFGVPPKIFRNNPLLSKSSILED